MLAAQVRLFLEALFSGTGISPRPLAENLCTTVVAVLCCLADLVARVSFGGFYLESRACS